LAYASDDVPCCENLGVHPTSVSCFSAATVERQALAATGGYRRSKRNAAGGRQRGARPNVPIATVERPVGTTRLLGRGGISRDLPATCASNVVDVYETIDLLGRNRCDGGVAYWPHRAAGEIATGVATAWSFGFLASVFTLPPNTRLPMPRRERELGIGACQIETTAPLTDYRMPMHVTRVSTASELAALLRDWNCLAGGVPFRRHEWLVRWWTHYGTEHGANDRPKGTRPGSELFVLAVRDSADHLVGIAPWYIEPTPTGGRVVRFLGSGEICTDYLSLLATPEFAPQVATAVADYLHEPAARAWDALDLEGIDAEDATIRRLGDALDGRGAMVTRRAGLNCWRLALPESWNAYLAGVSKSHRKQLRRIETRLLDTGRAKLHSIRGNGPDQSAALDVAWNHLIDLHQRRRKALGQNGCFASPRFAAFQGDVSRRMADAGALRLDWLEIDGKPAAAEYHLTAGGIAFAYQAGVAPEMIDDEPGRAITVALIRQAIADGLTAIDFLRGDEPYKAHFRAEPRKSIVLRVVAPRAAARWRNRAWQTGDGLKRIVKAGLQTAGVIEAETGKSS
jgi:CelD/BcsL family acetyltransferase involved in cellulose biosynthesis